MLAEREIEEKLKSHLAVTGYRAVTSRGGVQVEDADDIGTIAIGVGVRQHDAFSLPTVNVSGAVAVATRKEMDLSGARHDAAVDAVIGKLARLHDYPEELAALFAGEDASFIPAAIRLDGGAVTSRTNEIATDTINFTLRGVITPPVTQNQAE